MNLLPAAHASDEPCEVGNETLQPVFFRRYLFHPCVFVFARIEAMRVSRPAGYFASGLKDPLLAVILVFVVAGMSPASVGAVILLYAVRMTAVTLFSRSYVKDMLLPRFFWLLPLRDIVTFIAWLLAFTGNRVKWRGDTFRILAGGKMVSSCK